MRRSREGDGLRLKELGASRDSVFVQRLEGLSLKLFAYRKAALLKAAHRLLPDYVVTIIGPKNEGYQQWTMILEYQSTHTRSNAVKAARLDEGKEPSIYYDRTHVTIAHDRRVRKGRTERKDVPTAQPMRAHRHYGVQTLLWMLFNEDATDANILAAVGKDFPRSKLLKHSVQNIKAQRWRWREDAQHELEYGKRLL